MAKLARILRKKKPPLREGVGGGFFEKGLGGGFFYSLATYSPFRLDRVISPFFTFSAIEV